MTKVLSFQLVSFDAANIQVHDQNREEPVPSKLISKVRFFPKLYVWQCMMEAKVHQGAKVQIQI